MSTRICTILKGFLIRFTFNVYELQVPMVLISVSPLIRQVHYRIITESDTRTRQPLSIRSFIAIIIGIQRLVRTLLIFHNFILLL